MTINEKVCLCSTDPEKLYWTKLFLLCNGMTVDSWEHTGMRRAGPSTGIELTLTLGGSRINVKTPRYITRPTPAKLTGNTLVINNEMVCSADIMPVPIWYNKKVQDYPVTQVLNAHGKFLVTSVYEQCVLFAKKKECVFCSMNQSLQDEALLIKKPQLIVEALEYALSAESYEGIILNGGMMFDSSGGIRNYISIVEKIRKRFPSLQITVETTPPKDIVWLERLVDVGISSITMNMETWDPVARQKIIPGKHEFYSLDDYWKAFEKANQLLPKGNVSSCMVFGTESIQTTMQGIDEITSRGILVSPIARRYFDDIPSFQDGPNPDYQDFKFILDYAKKLHHERGIVSFFGCQKCNMCDPIGNS